MTDEQLLKHLQERNTPLDLAAIHCINRHKGLIHAILQTINNDAPILNWASDAELIYYGHDGYHAT